MRRYLWFLSLVCSTSVISGAKFDIQYEWSWIDYLWDSDEQRLAAIELDHYNYTKPVIIDVDVWKGRRKKDLNIDVKTFITVIRRSGVPASLTTVSNEIGYGGPLLRPYPNWRWAQLGDCDGITSVFRVAVDECDRLWVLDTGKVEDERICPAQLLAFDLHTDRLLKRVKIPKIIAESSINKLGLLVTPIVETEGITCKRTHVYMADVTGNALVIFNGSALWRLESPVFAYQELAANLTIADETFYLDDGVLGMALSPPYRNHRYLMFRPLASFDMISAATSNLHTSQYGPIRYTVVSNALPSQSASMAFSNSGILILSLIQLHAVACWNMLKPITEENIVVLDRDRDYYQFVSGVKVLSKYRTQGYDEVWIVSNRYQKIALGTQNFHEINFRVMSQRLDVLVKDTNCDLRSRFEKFLNTAQDFIWDYGGYFWNT